VKLDGVALIQTTKTTHHQGGVHIYGVVPHPKMLEVDLINSYMNYFIKKDYDYIGFLGPDIHFEDTKVLQNLAIGLDRWNLDVISPESAEDLKYHGMGLRDDFTHDMLHSSCWITNPATVRAILNEYGYFLDPRYKTPKYLMKDLEYRLEQYGFTFGLHRGVEYYGPRVWADTTEDEKRYMNQYAIRTSGEEEDSDPLEHADNDEQE